MRRSSSCSPRRRSARTSAVLGRVPSSNARSPTCPGGAPACSWSLSTERWSAWSTFEHRDAERRGPGTESGEAELGYLFLPEAWGHGYATEACTAALGWFADALPGERVVLRTRVENDRAMRLAVRLGFTEVARYEEYGAAQWSGVWSPPAPSG